LNCLFDQISVSFSENSRPWKIMTGIRTGIHAMQWNEIKFRFSSFFTESWHWFLVSNRQPWNRNTSALTLKIQIHEHNPIITRPNWIRFIKILKR
jgi:hypothetical protein